MSTERFVAFAATMLVAAASIADQAGPAPSQPAAAPVAAGVSPPLISQQALLERQAKGDPSLFVLDVRTPQEFASGHVPGAVNVPYDQVCLAPGRRSRRTRMSCSTAGPDVALDSRPSARG